MKRFIGTALLSGTIATLATNSLVLALNYGEGTYGTCQYSSCSISVASTPSVDLSITPSGSSTKCSVASNSVEVDTASSTGYYLQIASTDSTNPLTGSVSGEHIVAASGSLSTPALLAANKWGYRIDSGNFGSGPTSSFTNGDIPALTYAAVPINTTPDSIVNSSEPADHQTTTVWYGACADMAIPADTYSDDVVYTAVIN